MKDCPSSPLVPNALMALGWIAENKKDSTAAMAAYQQMVDKYPDDPLAADAYFRLGMLLNDAKEYQHAIDMLQKVPAGYQYADQAAYAIAWAYRDLGKQTEANDGLQSAWPSSFRRAHWPATASTASENTGWKQKNEVEAVRALQPGAGAAARRRANCAPRWPTVSASPPSRRRTTRWRSTTFDKVLTECPDDENTGDCLFWKGQSLELQGDDHAAAAREAYLKYLANFPGGPLVLDAALGAGRAALEEKQYAPALADLQKALELCNTLGQTGELSQARRRSETGSEIHPRRMLLRASAILRGIETICRRRRLCHGTLVLPRAAAGGTLQRAHARQHRRRQHPPPAPQNLPEQRRRKKSAEGGEGVWVDAGIDRLRFFYHEDTKARRHKEYFYACGSFVANNGIDCAVQTLNLVLNLLLNLSYLTSIAQFIRRLSKRLSRRLSRRLSICTRAINSGVRDT